MGQQRMRWLDGITSLMDTSLSKLRDSEGQGSLTCYSPWGPKESDNLVTEQQQSVSVQLLSRVWLCVTP